MVIFGGLLLGRGIPLLPGQILWLNLVTDSAPALALGVQPSRKGIMERPPRKLGQEFWQKVWVRKFYGRDFNWFIIFSCFWLGRNII